MGQDAAAGNGIALSPQPLPKHVAFLFSSTALRNILEIIQAGIALRIPILTFHLDDNPDALLNLLTALIHWDFIEKNQVKISVLGKWYDLPERLIAPIKQALESTRDYDAHFLNLCIKYDGQEEIVDACRIIARQVQLNKLSPEGVTKAAIKENIYASYFLPPDLVVLPGTARTHGLLLWDSPKAIIHPAPEHPDQYAKDAFLRSIKFYQDARQ